MTIDTRYRTAQKTDMRAPIAIIYFHDVSYTHTCSHTRTYIYISSKQQKKVPVDPITYKTRDDLHYSNFTCVEHNMG